MPDTITPPKPPLLIGLCGRAGAGKSTVARYLETEYSFFEIALAEPIFDMLCALFNHAGVDGAWMVERSLKELPSRLGYSYRRLAQTLGTEWARNQLHPDFWLKLASLRLARPHMADENVVVSDIRFPNEAEWLRQRGGVLVRVLRDGLPEVARHSSERHAEQLPADAELLNHGSRATLADQVDRLIDTLRKP